MTVVADAAVEPTPLPSSAPGRWRQALSGLFPDSPAAPRPGRRGVLLAGAAVAVGTIVSLLRTAGTGPFQSIWEEDARNVLTDALQGNGARAVLRPIAGYEAIPARILGELATFFPLSWAAAVLSISAAVICAVLALQIYLASGAHFDNRFARFLVSAPMLFAPAAENYLSEIYNRPVCMHFFAMYALFWVLLWSPTGRPARAGMVATVLFTGLSTIMIAFYLPLALLRLVIRRDRLSAVLFGATAVGLLIQIGGLLNSSRSVPMRLDPVWAAGNTLLWGVPNALLGFKSTRALGGFGYGFQPTLSENLLSISLAWLFAAAVIVAAVVAGRRGLLRPRWALAALASGYGAFLLSVMLAANGLLAQRYLLAFEMLVFTAIVALLTPAKGADPRKAWAGLAVFAVFLGVISVLNYRWNDTYRAHAPRWTEQLAAASAACKADPRLAQVTVHSGPMPWFSTVIVPCHELRFRPCVEPQCLDLEPAQSLPALSPSPTRTPVPARDLGPRIAS